MLAQVPFDHLWSIGDHYQDFSVQILEGLIVMAQLRHMIGAVWSGKADVENQQHVLLLKKVG